MINEQITKHARFVIDNMVNAYSLFRGDYLLTKVTIDGQRDGGRSPSLTFLLLASLALVAYLYSAHGQDDGDYEEQDAADDARRYSFVLHPRRHRELHLLGTLVAGRGVR